MSRMTELLEMAADKFDDLSNPFDRSVLIEHNITLDECGDLSQGIASIIRMYLASPPELRAKMALSYAIHKIHGEKGIEAAMSVIDRDTAMKRVLAKLETMNEKK